MERRTFPNEPPEYRAARDELLRAEVALREQSERVAALRRDLPVGGRIKEDYAFETLGADGQIKTVRLSELFQPGKDSLFVYGFMFGPKAERPCPMCTALLDALDGQVRHLRERVNIAVVARSPIERLVGFGESRGWRDLPLYSSAKCTYQSDYFAEDAEGGQWPMANLFVRRDGAIHHFWGTELLFEAFEGGDPRHMDTAWPLWNVLDFTPEGRGGDWYPKLAY